MVLSWCPHCYSYGRSSPGYWHLHAARATVDRHVTPELSPIHIRLPMKNYPITNIIAQSINGHCECVALSLTQASYVLLAWKQVRP